MEIGSVLELEPWDHYPFSEKSSSEICFPFMRNRNYQVRFYQSGRNCIEVLLKFLMKKNGIREIFMPDFVCDSVTAAANRAGISVTEYHVSEEYEISVEELESIRSKDACLYFVHYFGKKPSNTVLDFAKNWMRDGGIVIEDVTMSLLSHGEGIGFGSYVIGSVRKWFPIPDGGLLASESEELPDEPDPRRVSRYSGLYSLVQEMKREYVEGGEKNKELKKIYRDYYQLAIKDLFSDFTIYPMSDLSKNYLLNADFSRIFNKRASNYDYLYDHVKDLKGIKVKVIREEGFLPFGMVIAAKERDVILQELIKEDVYCNVHWKFEKDNPTDAFLSLSSTSMTIPCDQRYDLHDVDRIINILKRCVEK